MGERFRKEEQYLLDSLRVVLTEGEDRKIPVELDEKEWEHFYSLSTSHAVLPLLYELLEKDEVPQSLWRHMEQKCRQTVQQSYHLLFLTKFLSGLLEENGIPVVVLKGAAVASFYPVPELRKSGDVDLLIFRESDLEKACALLEEHKFIKKGKQYHNHHMEYVTQDGIAVELHGMLVEPFANRKMNRCLERQLEECAAHTCRLEVCGIPVPSFSEGYHAYYLLLHMLQHFLLAGFGLRYLCDWVLFWNREVEEEEKEIFLRLVKESGLWNFAGAVSACCVRYLGLNEERVTFLEAKNVSEQDVRELMREILDSGEFGGSETDRMVGMEGTGIFAYVKEFHHQMRLNYPRAGKCALFWPILWIMTFIRFLRNNRVVRKVSSLAVLKKARQRSRLIRRLHLFLN